jgi:alpha-tubulin suppressor-like RCC1 family protein
MAVYVFGSGKSGELGTGVNRVRTRQATLRTPTRVTGLPSVRQVSSGTSYSLYLASDGSLYAFGASKHGRAGIPKDANVPRLVVLRERIVQVACG